MNKLEDSKTGGTMNIDKEIQGKRILIVDDEQDVLDVLANLLHICKIDTAASFEEAKQLLEQNTYDIAILDIMGVRGFDLLAIARNKDVPVLMLTAHALSEESLKRSAEDGASYYAPKEKIQDIKFFVYDVLNAKEKNPWVKWFERLGGFYDHRFGGKDWREKHREFWKEQLKGLSSDL
jgi:CheY-like chemotaxis protein